MTTVCTSSPTRTRRRKAYEPSSWYLSDQFWDALQFECCNLVDEFNPFIDDVDNRVVRCDTSMTTLETKCKTINSSQSLSRIDSKVSLGYSDKSSFSTNPHDRAADLLHHLSTDFDGATAISTPKLSLRTSSPSKETTLTMSDALTSMKSSLVPRLRCDPTSPASLLNLAANYLDDLVLLTRTPISPAMWDESEVGILESEVFINVIEDGNRTKARNSIELRGHEAHETLNIPSTSNFGILSGNCGFQSSITVDCPAETAQELDALSWMGWERQLTNLQASWWY